MKKLFELWNRLKQQIHTKEISHFFFHEREIFFANLGQNIGTEMNGKGERFLRPVLILKKFGKDSAFVVPLSTQKKEGKFYFSFTSTKGILTTALLSQSRLIDVKRLQKRKGRILTDDFSLLKKELGKLLGIF